MGGGIEPGSPKLIGDLLFKSPELHSVRSFRVHRSYRRWRIVIPRRSACSGVLCLLEDTMPFGDFGGGNSAEDDLKKQSSLTQRHEQDDNDNSAGDEEEARLGQESRRSSSVVEGTTRPRVLLCVSGSVAVVKVPQLAMMLNEFAEVKTSMPAAAVHPPCSSDSIIPIEHQPRSLCGMLTSAQQQRPYAAHSRASVRVDEVPHTHRRSSPLCGWRHKHQRVAAAAAKAVSEWTKINPSAMLTATCCCLLQ